MWKQDVFFAERNFSEIYCITEVEKVAEMYGVNQQKSDGHKREDELLAVPRVSGRQGMHFRTSPVISGSSYIEVEPLNKRFVPSTVGLGFQSSGATHMPDRVEVYETNRLLSDDQIQRFISSTVLPHHRTLTNSNGRTLTNSDGVSWSQAPIDSRPAPPSFQKRNLSKTGNYAYPSLVGNVQRRPVPQGNPVLISVPQGTQRGSPRNRAHFYHNTQGMPTESPHQFSVSQRRQEFLVPLATRGNTFNTGIHLSTGTQTASGHQEDINNHNRINEGISMFPQGIQDKIISIPQGSQGEIFRVPVLTTDGNDILQEIFVNQEGKGEIVEFPSGTPSLSHEPSGLEGKDDDIIIVHQGKPEELINVVQETLQEIMGVPQGNTISQGTAEDVTFHDETGKEIMGFSAGTVEEILGIAQDIKIPHGSVDEIMGIPKGIPVPQETLHEIMGIMATVPDETIHEIMGFPQGIAVPQGVPNSQGTQGQASPVYNQNRCEGNSGHCQEQLSFWKLHPETAPTSNVTAQQQLGPSCNQSMQNLTQQTSPEQEKPKHNPLLGGTTQGRAYDPDPLLASLSVPTNANWGGSSELQKSNGNSLVKDTMIYDYELNGNSRKRKIGTESEDTSSKRQRRDQTTNLDTSNYNRDAGLMVLPERSPENEEFFASIERCLELSSENFPSNEKYALFEDLDNASLETFPSKVIDDIYKNTFESDRFLSSDDDFVTNSLAFLKEGGDFELGGLW